MVTIRSLELEELAGAWDDDSLSLAVRTRQGYLNLFVVDDGMYDLEEVFNIKID